MRGVKGPFGGFDIYAHRNVGVCLQFNVSKSLCRRNVEPPFHFHDARFKRGYASAEYRLVRFHFKYAPVVALGVALERMKELRLDTTHRFQKLVLGGIDSGLDCRFYFSLRRGLAAIFHNCHLQLYGKKLPSPYFTFHS